MKAKSKITMFSSLQRLARIALFFGLGAALTACGPTISPKAPSHPAQGGMLDFGSDGTGSLSTECTPFESTRIKLSGSLTTYYWNGQRQDGKFRFRIKSLTDQFGASGVSIKMFRWKAEGSSINFDSTPLSFTLEKGTVGSQPIGSTMTSFSGADLSNLRQTSSIPGTSVQEFFDNTVFVVPNLTWDWQVLQIVVYQGTAAIGWVDVLLPAFEANPNTYGASHPAQLNNVHPFWNQRALPNMSDTAWSSKARASCF